MAKNAISSLAEDEAVGRPRLPATVSGFTLRTFSGPQASSDFAADAHPEPLFVDKRPSRIVKRAEHFALRRPMRRSRSRKRLLGHVSAGEPKRQVRFSHRYDARYDRFQPTRAP